MRTGAAEVGRRGLSSASHMLKAASGGALRGPSRYASAAMASDSTGGARKLCRYACSARGPPNVSAAERSALRWRISVRR